MSITIDEAELNAMGDAILGRIVGIQDDVESDMAHAYKDAVMGNLGGTSGAFRPMEWAPLCEKYARRVGRTHATLIWDGYLMSAVQVRGNSVFTSDSDVPYATAHQFGSRKAHLPPRPYFPMLQNEDPTPEIQARMAEVAGQSVERRLK